MSRRTLWIIIAVVVVFLGCGLCSAVSIAVDKYGVIDWAMAKVVTVPPQPSNPSYSDPGYLPPTSYKPVFPANPAPESQPQIDLLAPSSAECVITSEELAQWRQEALETTGSAINAVGYLREKLDRRWEQIAGMKMEACGEWYNPGADIPGNTVLWTNFHWELAKSPAKAVVNPFVVDGEYGIWISTGAFKVPPENSGGRYLFIQGIMEGAAVPSVQMGTCVSTTEAEVLRGGVDAYNAFFAEVGYGSDVAAGASVSGPVYFLGTFGAGMEPEAVVKWDGGPGTGGFVWYIPAGVNTTAPNGGRVLPACQ